jgi:hypothetical protein
MKIAIQGSIIETDNIYCIGKIVENNDDRNKFLFEIESFNDNNLEVSIDMYEENKISIKCEEHRAKYFNEIIKTEERKKEMYNEIQNLQIEHRLENKARLERMRQDIYKIWSENQPKLPMFDTKNY